MIRAWAPVGAAMRQRSKGQIACVDGKIVRGRSRTRPRLPVRTLSGISVTALAVALLTAPAAAENLESWLPRFREALVGTGGRDAEKHFFTSDVSSTPGQTGPGRDYTNIGTLGMDGTPGPVFSISSMGGNGGDAAGTLAASRGGNGGGLAFRNDAVVKGGRQNGFSLLTLASQGGNGGVGALASYEAGGADGGAGGAVSIYNAGEIQTRANEVDGMLVMLRSTGGAGGVRGGKGGAGGDATFVQAGTIQKMVTTSAASPVIAVISAGGAGGRAGEMLGSGAGGDAGTAHFMQYGAVIEAEGTYALGTALVSVLSQGGTGGAGYVGRPEGGRHDGLLQSAARGGRGGAAIATIEGNVTTSGDRFAALHVTSAGGNAGASGSTVPGQVAAIAGGGSAGQASVTVAAKAMVSTSGQAAPAVIVEAIAGRGSSAAGLGFASGAAGGRGGSVIDTVEKPSVLFDNAGTVSTSGGNSTAVVLQSVAGNGGDSSTWQGNAGGGGGRVRGTNTGMIDTVGSYSFGIVAQSIGGSGGKGASGLFIAGDGGAAGKGGEVNIVNAAGGQISTHGIGSTAVVAQSVGGGAGLDAFHSQAILPNGAKAREGVGTVDVTRGGGGAGGDAFGLFFARGGDGGSGGMGGTVHVDNLGTISTEGEAAYGILAQSIGGSGGAAGNATAAGAFLAVAIGGAGGGGGAGGTVEFGSKAGAETFSVARAAAVAKALEGMTGPRTPENVSLAVDAAGRAFDQSYASVTTEGSSAAAVIAQSVGGGGGMGGSALAASAGAVASVSVSVGGSGGKGGAGGVIDVWNTSALTTSGIGSAGIQAHSIGGGGGSAGSARSYAIAVGAGPYPAVPVSVAVGGSGGDGGDGGTVTLRNYSSVITRNASSPGLEALSIGGGGGSAGNAFSYALGIQAGAAPSVDINVSVGGSGGKGGAGGTITGLNNGIVETTGVASHGLTAMSIGGGGGKGGDARSVAALASFYLNIAVPVTVGGSGGDGGKGGEVKVDNNGLIHTRGQFSNGIDVSSIGGGGGNGGIANGAAEVGLGYDWYGSETISALMSAMPTGKAITASVTIGGSGGGGGHGDLAKATNTGTILTEGTNSSGIVAYSIGGGGGSGGGFQGGGKGNIAANLRIGGSGGEGGNGGTVTVENKKGASIETRQDGSHGIFAQSIGGGGNGGTFTGKRKSGVVNNIGTENENWLAVGMKLAGEISKVNGAGKLFLSEHKLDKLPGETDEAHKTRQDAYNDQRVFRDKNFDKGSGVQVTMEYLDKITSMLKPVQSLAEASQKIENLEASKKGKSAAEIAKIDAEIEATRKKMLTEVPDQQVAALLSLFKDSLKKSFEHFGDEAKKAKSASFKDWEKYYPTASLNVAVGGAGGKGGKGGDVTVTNDGTVLTKGGLSYGVFSQSVGGGGGAGGGGFASGETQVAIDVSVGRNGAGGGDGGTVKAINHGSITTKGAASFGLLAQSVGGGGGVGGASSAENGISLSANVMVGGNGGASGAGGLVTVTNDGVIHTEGKDAHALVAQSVGGGGGIFFNNLKSPRELELERQKEEAVKKAELAGATQTAEQKALLKKTEETVELVKKYVDFVGGKGEAGLDRWATILPTPSLNLNLGGSGSGGGAGGTVAITHNGKISTGGAGAFGIFAQSIGGGGGFGSNASTNTIFSGDVTIGGKGGVAGDGGNVNLTLGRKASVATKGADAHAIFVQSIGGGGGYGGTGKYFLLPDIARSGGASGVGGEINIKMAEGGGASTLLLSTEGRGAHGIFAQSLGGGGGYAANLTGATIPETAHADRTRTGVSGRGRNVTIDTAGTISATGADAYGIFVQSGVQDGNGVIQKPGSEDHGSWPHINYVPVRHGGAVSITHSGTIVGGSGSGAAIRIDGGGYDAFAHYPSRAANTITIQKDSTVSALSGMAIKASWGTETIVNRGTIIGNIDLDGGYNEINTFKNEAGGTYMSIDLGRIVGPWPQERALTLSREQRFGRSVFHNAGTIDVGGIGHVSDFTLNGDLKMEAGGRLLIDTSPDVWGTAAYSDHVTVKGNTTFTAGARVDINPIRWYPGEYVFLTTTGRMDLQAMPTVTSIRESAVPVEWNPRQRASTAISGATELVLKPQANFLAPKGTTLSDDQRAVAERLQHGWDTAAGSMATRFARYLGIASGGSYAEALADATPESTGYIAGAKIASMRTSLKAAQSCPAFEGAGVGLKEGECVWGRVGVSTARMARSQDEGGYRKHGTHYRIGGQREIAPGWFLGGAASYTNSDLKDRADLTGFSSHSYEGSLALKHQAGPWLFSLSGSLGSTSQDSIRVIDTGGAREVARGKANVFAAAARLRGAYEFAFDGWYLRPYVDLDAFYLRTPLMRETGAPAFNLDVYGRRKTLFSVNPNVEVGGRFDLGGGTWMRPYASLGFTLLSSDKFTMQSSFRDDPVGLGAFRTVARIPDKLVDIGLGLQLSSGRGFELTAEYQSQLGKDYVSQTGSARLSWRF